MRQKFFAALCALCICLVFGTLAQAKDGSMTLLTLNRLAGQLLPIVTRVNKGTVAIGGLAHAAGVVQKVRETEPNAILIVNGGSVYGPMWRYFGGRPEFTSLNLAGVQVGTIGMRELDFGWEHLKGALQYIRFPLVLSNVDVLDPEAAPFFKKNVIVQAGALKVGFFSMLSPQILTTTTQKVDELQLSKAGLVETAKAMVADLRAQGADVIVMLSNLTDLENQHTLEQVSGIHAVYGRTLGLTEDPMPGFVRGPDNWLTTTLWSGTVARFVGRLDLTTRDGRITEDSVKWQLLSVTPKAEPNAAILNLATQYEEKLNKKLETIMGSFNVPVDARKEVLRSGESPIGNFLADALRSRFRTDVSLANAGNIRGNKIFREGKFSEKTLQELFPYQSRVDILTVSGDVLRKAMEISASALAAHGDGYDTSFRTPTGGFLQVSGLRVVYDLKNPPTTFNEDGLVAQWGSRLADLRVEKDGSWEPVEDSAYYTVAISSWLSEGGDRYYLFKGLPSQDSGLLDYEVLVGYIKTFPDGALKLALDQRITVRK